MIANAPIRVNVTAQKMARFLPDGKRVFASNPAPNSGTRPLLKRQVRATGYSLACLSGADSLQVSVEDAPYPFSG